MKHKTCPSQKKDFKSSFLIIYSQFFRATFLHYLKTLSQVYLGGAKARHFTWPPVSDQIQVYLNLAGRGDMFKLTL